ncbi:MAG: DNRLRE domain-containing protein, partial [Acidimicrobiales bacterium]
MIRRLSILVALGIVVPIDGWLPAMASPDQASGGSADLGPSPDEIRADGQERAREAADQGADASASDTDGDGAGAPPAPTGDRNEDGVYVDGDGDGVVKIDPPAATPTASVGDVRPGEIVERAGTMAASGTPRERPDLRTADSRTTDNADGTFSTEVSDRPINYLDSAGRWQPIDTTLRDSGGRLRVDAVASPVSLGRDAAAPQLAQVQFDEGSVGFGLEGARSRPAVVDGDSATYLDVLSSVDVKLTATGQGVKETLVLGSASAPQEFRFPLTLGPGLEARLEQDSGDVVVFLADTPNEEVAVIPAGWVRDSGRDPETGGTPDALNTTYRLERNAGRLTLVQSLPAGYLTDPARVFPVLADPTFTDAEVNLDDTWLHQHFPTTNRSSDPILKAGGGPDAANGYIDVDRVYYVKFNLGAFTRAKILNAEYFTFNTYSYSCLPRPVWLYRVTEPWDGATMHYAGVGYDGNAIGAKEFAHGYAPGGCPNAEWENFN